MRIDLGTAEHFVHPVDEAIGDDVLQQLCLVMHFVPAKPHHLHEEQLHETMAPEHERGEPPPGARERDAGIGLVVDQP
jgi:hypothetical protein